MANATSWAIRLPRLIPNALMRVCSSSKGWVAPGARAAPSYSPRLLDDEEDKQGDNERVDRDRLSEHDRQDHVRADQVRSFRVAPHRSERGASQQTDADARANRADANSETRSDFEVHKT